MSPRRPTSPWLVLAAVLSGTLSGTLGNSVANIAVPSIMAEYGTPLASTVWVVSLYTLCFAVLMPVGGYLGDRYGLRRMFLLGMGLYDIGALGSGLAPTFPWLLGSRALMGIGVAPTLPAVMGIIAWTFPPDKRGRAMGFWALANSGGHALGPLVSGFLTQHFGWRSVFLLGVPLSVMTMAMVAWLVLALPPSAKDGRFDVGGALTLTTTALSLMLALTQSSQHGWTSGAGLGLWGVALVALAAFVAMERRAEYPFVDLSLFANRRYMAAVATISAEIFCLFGLMLALPVFLIQAKDWTSQMAGVLAFPLPLSTALISPLAGRLVDTRGSRTTCSAGAILMGVGGLALLAVVMRFGAAAPWWVLLGCLVVAGSGMGLIQSPSATVAIEAVRPEQVGVATGVFHMGRFLSGSLGSTVFGLVLQGDAGGVVGGFRSSVMLLVVMASLAVFAARRLDARGQTAS